MADFAPEDGSESEMDAESGADGKSEVGSSDFDGRHVEPDDVSTDGGFARYGWGCQTVRAAASAGGIETLDLGKRIPGLQVMGPGSVGNRGSDPDLALDFDLAN